VSATLDVDILVHASNRDDPLHERAAALIEQLAAGPELVVLFWPVLLGYLRIVTHPAILPDPLPPRDAMGNVESLVDRPHIRVAGEIDGFWPVYRSVAGDRPRGTNVPDAHLVALMRQHGVRRIWTRDRDFRRFDGIEPRDPFA
jgi:toxin-antitoxin system PIN domain toxin